MAIVSGQLKDIALSGKPRDLSEEIFNAAPSDTPFLTLCKKSQATQTLHEWQTDELAAPGENSRLEGAETESFTNSSTAVLTNRTQILSKAVHVSGTADAVRQAGVVSQYDYQLALRTKELKKDVEYALLQNRTSRADNGTASRLMTGLSCWLGDNASLGEGGSASSGDAAAVAGTLRLPDEADLKALLTDIYNAGGNPDRIMMAPDIRVKMSEVLNGGATRVEHVEERTATAVVDVFVSDFGTLKLVPNRVQGYVPYAKNCAFVLDPEYWAVAYLRPFREQKLALTGDGQKGHVIVECTLEARQPKASGMLADLKAS